MNPLSKTLTTLLLSSTPTPQIVVSPQVGSSAGRDYQHLGSNEDQQLGLICERRFGVGEIGHLDDSLEKDEVDSLEETQKKTRRAGFAKLSRTVESWKSSFRFHMQDCSAELSELPEKSPVISEEYLQEEWRLRRELKKRFSLKHPLVIDNKSVKVYIIWLQERAKMKTAVEEYSFFLETMKEIVPKFSVLKKTSNRSEQDLRIKYMNGLKDHLFFFNNAIKVLKRANKHINSNIKLNVVDPNRKNTIINGIISVYKTIVSIKDPNLNEHADNFMQLSKMPPCCCFKSVVWDRIRSLEVAISSTQNPVHLATITEQINALKSILDQFKEFMFREVMVNQINSLRNLVKSQMRDAIFRIFEIEPYYKLSEGDLEVFNLDMIDSKSNCSTRLSELGLILREKLVNDVIKICNIIKNSKNSELNPSLGELPEKLNDLIRNKPDNFITSLPDIFMLLKHKINLIRNYKSLELLWEASELIKHIDELQINIQDLLKIEEFLDHVFAVRDAINLNQDFDLRRKFEKHAQAFNLLLKIKPSYYFKLTVRNLINSLKTAIANEGNPVKFQSINSAILQLETSLAQVPKTIFQIRNQSLINSEDKKPAELGIKLENTELGSDSDTEVESENSDGEPPEINDESPTPAVTPRRTLVQASERKTVSPRNTLGRAHLARWVVQEGKESEV